MKKEKKDRLEKCIESLLSTMIGLKLQIYQLEKELNKFKEKTKNGN